MFAQYCGGCPTKFDCLESAQCIRGLFNQYFDNNIAEVSELTEREQFDDDLLFGQLPEGFLEKYAADGSDTEDKI